MVIAFLALRIVLPMVNVNVKCNLFNVKNTRECLRDLPSRWLVIMCLTIIQIELEFGNVGFYEGRKTGVPGEKPSEQRQQTQPTFDAETGNRTRATLVRGLRGKQNAQPLRHPCSPHCTLHTVTQDLQKGRGRESSTAFVTCQLHPGSTACSDTLKGTRIEVIMAKTVGFVFLSLVIVWVPESSLAW